MAIIAGTKLRAMVDVPVSKKINAPSPGRRLNPAKEERADRQNCQAVLCGEQRVDRLQSQLARITVVPSA
jgi:hypothetical protein